MLIGLAAALGAAVLFGVLAVVQARAIRQHGLLSRLMAVVLAGYLLGWLLHLVAIARLPLYLAQAGVAVSLVVTALVASFVMSEPLHASQWLAVGGIVVGLAVLAVAAGPIGHSRFTAGTTLTLWLALAGNALLGLIAGRFGGRGSGIALGVLAGVAYGLSPVATRALVDPARGLPTLFAVLSIGLFGALGFVLYTYAMQRAAVTAATAPLVVLQTLLPATIGLLAFGDQVRPGWWIPALLAFAVSLVAGAVLCGAEARLDVLDPLGLGREADD